MLPKRILWIDLARSLAIILMIVFHTAFDLQTLYGWNIDVFHGGWNGMRIFTASLFLGLAGISTHFTRHPYKRAGRIAMAAAAVTLATFLWDPETYVRFGILHCIAVSVVLLPLLSKLQLLHIPLGILIMIAGNLFTDTTVNTSLLLPFGFTPPLFTTLDYYPLLPWFGVTLIGYGIGFLLSQNTHQSPLVAHHSPLTANRSQLTALLTFPGRHALIIYLLHQPILIMILEKLQ